MYVCHLLLVLLAIIIIIITGSDVMAAFSEDEDDSSETVGSLEQAFSLYPEDFTEGNSEELGSLLLLLQQQQDKASPPDHRLPVDDFTGTDSPLEVSLPVPFGPGQCRRVVKDGKGPFDACCTVVSVHRNWFLDKPGSVRTRLWNA